LLNIITLLPTLLSTTTKA